jgi:hypothetical protein
MSKTESQQEPEAPAIELCRGRPAPAKPDLIGTQPPLGVRQGMPSLPDHNGFEQSESDRQEWLKDLEERRARALRLQQQRLEPVAVDVVSELDSALSALEHRNKLGLRVREDCPRNARSELEQKRLKI